MTHITEVRSTDNQTKMGRSIPAAYRAPLTAMDILRAGVRRRVSGMEMVAAQSAWDSEGGATGQQEALRSGGAGRAPRGLGR